MWNKNESLKRFENKVFLASPKMHGEELKYMTLAYETNWMSTVGENIDEVERQVALMTGSPYAVGLSSGTAALHMAMKLAGERLYGKNPVGVGALAGKRVFCSDVTFDATVNPVVYEGGEPVFIDTEYDTWNMDPIALEKAFELYPEVRLVVMANLYGTPGKLAEIRKICDAHGALLIEDAAESLAATYDGKQTGIIGDYGIVSFNGNKLITGSAGGCILVKDAKDAGRVRKWSTQAREAASWYQHEELGYNYRISNVIAGVVRGQLSHVEEHRSAKKDIYMRYKEAFEKANLPVQMNPYEENVAEPNFWLSCMIIDEAAMCKQVRGESEVLYISENGKSCPTEILDAISAMNAEGRPVWKPMHMQPIYRNNAFVTREGSGRALTNAYIKGGNFGADGKPLDVGGDIFERGLCLPSDINMTAEQQDEIIKTVIACFE